MKKTIINNSVSFNNKRASKKSKNESIQELALNKEKNKKIANHGQQTVEFPDRKETTHSYLLFTIQTIHQIQIDNLVKLPSNLYVGIPDLN